MAAPLLAPTQTRFPPMPLALGATAAPPAPKDGSANLLTPAQFVETPGTPAVAKRMSLTDPELVQMLRGYLD